VEDEVAAFVHSQVPFLRYVERFSAKELEFSGSAVLKFHPQSLNLV